MNLNLTVVLVKISEQSLACGGPRGHDYSLSTSRGRYNIIAKDRDSGLTSGTHNCHFLTCKVGTVISHMTSSCEGSRRWCSRPGTSEVLSGCWLLLLFHKLIISVSVSFF